MLITVVKASIFTAPESYYAENMSTENNGRKAWNYITRVQHSKLNLITNVYIW